MDICYNETAPIVIVMGRNYASRLGMIRAVGMAGCEVIVIQTKKQQKRICKIDACSRYVKKSLVCNEPNKDHLIELIMALKNEKRKVILMPTDDYTAWAIDEHYDYLKNYFLMPTVNHEQGGMSRVMDKLFQKQLARNLGLNVAKGWLCKKVNGSYVIPEDVSYPCFSKPLESHSGPLKEYIRKCDTKEDLIELLAKVPALYSGSFLIEEYHQIGKEYAVVGMAVKDQVFMPAVIQMLSDLDGVTATGRIFPASTIVSLEKALSRFVKELNLMGLFDIDLYESGGIMYFNEFNARFGASGYALTASSVNLPSAFVHFLTEGEIVCETRIFSDSSFANEKTILARYYNKKINYQQFEHDIKADILFIKDCVDPMPYREFSKYKSNHLTLFLWRTLARMKCSIGRQLRKYKQNA